MLPLRIVLLALPLLLCACATAGNNSQNAVSMSQTSRGVVIQSSDRILFDTGKADIKPTAKPFLDQVANILNTKSTSSVVIEGHTDNVGRAELNQALSELRALTVMEELVKRGVPNTRIKASGFGMTRPVAENDSENGRQLNRRTEIILLGEKEENLKGSGFDNFMNSMRGLFK